MKKLLLLLMLSFIVVGCGTVDNDPEIDNPIVDPDPDPDPDIDPDPEPDPEPEVEMVPKSALEILTEVFELAEVEMFSSLSSYGNDEESILGIERLLTNAITGEGIEITNLVDGALAAPMMMTDARTVMVIQLSDDSLHEEIEAALENLSTYKICVRIDEYQIAVNGNYLLFAGMEEHQSLVDAFLGMELERPVDEISNKSSLSVLSRSYINAGLTMLPGLQVYSSNEFEKKQVEDIISKDEEIILETYLNAVMNQDVSSFDKLVFMVQLSGEEEIDLIVEKLPELVNHFSWTETPIDGFEIGVNGNYVLFAGIEESLELVEAFEALDL
ncbi:hypothetical protein KHQ82_01440 [Mycoplasmatota bacterium]|nr:hypothetical protein KHQ82_01440 [Mycoplasmatota bacterium]